MKIGGGSATSGERCPPGFHVGVLAGVYDVGRQPGFNDEDPVKHKVCLVWEMSARDSKGRRHVLFDLVTASSHEKSAMAKRFLALAGRPMTQTEMEEGFDMDTLLGKSAYLMLVGSKKEGGRPRIDSLAPLPPGVPALEQEVPYAQDDPPKFVLAVRAHAIGVGKDAPAF